MLLDPSYDYHGMPEEVMADLEELGMMVAREVEAAAPSTYQFDCYTIEN
ncbi:hypothetical protein [Sorangium sp. So ce117]